MIGKCAGNDFREWELTMKRSSFVSSVGWACCLAFFSLFLLSESAEAQLISPKVQQDLPRIAIGIMAKLDGAKKGFFLTNGQPAYHDWNTNVGKIAIPLEGANAAKFKVYKQPKKSKALFGLDDNNVYVALQFFAQRIEDADAASFSLITADGLYSRDAKRVYVFGLPLDGADPDSFEVLTYPFAQDAERVFIGTEEIVGADRASWRPLRAGRMGSVWEGETPKPKDKLYLRGWSRDAQNVYFGLDAVPDIDVLTFEVLSDKYAKDAKNVYSWYGSKRTVIAGADPATFTVSKDVDQSVVGGKAQDANHKYSRGKRIPVPKAIGPDEVLVIRNDSLSDELKGRIIKIHRAFSDIDTITLNKRVALLKSHPDTERLLRNYESLAKAYTNYCNGKNLSLGAKREVYKAAQFKAMGAPKGFLKRMKFQHISKEDAEEISRGVE